jgi:hypothetical protein
VLPPLELRRPVEGIRSGAIRWTGVAAVVALWVTVAVGIALTDLMLIDDRPISHLGTVARSRTLFSVGLVLAALLLAAFFMFVWRAFAARPSFLVAALVGQVGQVVAAVVPISGAGSAHAVHTAAGLILGLSLPLLMWRFAAGLAAAPWRPAASRLCWLEVAACVAGVILSRAGVATLAEILPALGFHLWIAVVTAWSLPLRCEAEVGEGEGHAPLDDRAAA